MAQMTFERIEKRINSAYTRAYNIMATGYDKKERTYFDIWKDLSALSDFAKIERKGIERDLREMERTYAPEFLKQKREELVSKVDAVVKKAVTTIRNNIQDQGEIMNRRVVESLSVPPTDEQIRLLNALQMRDDLDVVEMQYILPTFFHNYQAMQAFRSVCQQSRVKLISPVQMDFRAMITNIEKATDYLLGACDEVLRPERERSARYTAFFTVNTSEPEKCYDPKYVDLANALDGTPLLSECKTEKVALTATEQARIDWQYRGMENATENELLKHTAKVIAEDPGMLTLLKFTPYAEFARIADEAAKKAEAEPVDAQGENNNGVTE